MRTERTGLRTASFVACGLFLAEDPVVVAARQQFRGGGHGAAGTVAIDLALAVVMVAYNYLAIRFVARVSSAEQIERAIADLDRERDERRRRRQGTWSGRLRGAAPALNPFELVKRLVGRIGGLIDRGAWAARRRGRASCAALLGDLAAVNLLGVPGAGMRRVASGRLVTAVDSLRLTSLFVVSWFAGAWAIEGTLDRIDQWPLVGPPAGRAWQWVGAAYGAITDLGTPLGALSVVALGSIVVRYVRRVERRAATLAAPVAA